MANSSTADILQKMILFSNGNIHDINHFLKVYAFAGIIGKKENLDNDTLEILETAAILHDIACPLCREKYGNTNGAYQEKEGAPMAEKFLRELSFPKEKIDRVSFLVGHHHTYKDVNGSDYQILLEADFLVNADEGDMPKSAVEAALESIFKTDTGKALLSSIYLNK